ncbi:hypothetical protein Rhal01_02062 [Rubritalea halochordaticola]|uniref:Abasic site processing protein n=1 Tax=Rubritalea halochordaticola TaxID=714537 RepID=A0ABP9UZL4_9BACT
MCSVYDLAKKQPAQQDFDLLEGVMEVLQAMDERRLIRRTDRAPVMLADGTVEEMHWGYMRQGLGPVNNARSEKLDSPMWRESFAERRCLIPVAHFFEWSGPKGSKRTHRFEHPAGEWLWMAGMWEESREYGHCYTMLTTAANSLMEPIHKRMPAVLVGEEIPAYLAGDLREFHPSVACLRVEDALNPLLKNPPTHQQGELF